MKEYFTTRKSYFQKSITFTHVDFSAIFLPTIATVALNAVNVFCINKAAKTALVSLLIAACVSGALVDLGLPFFVFCAVGAAVVPRRESEGRP